MTQIRAADRARIPWSAALVVLLAAAPLSAQELDPRAYVHAPVNSTFLVVGFGLSGGGVLTDETLPLTEVKATVEAPSLAVGRTFDLFGKTAQALVAVPYSWAQVFFNVAGSGTNVARTGLADTRLRLSVLLRGAPAASIAEIAKAPRRTIVGASLSVVAPTGQFFPEKLINIGANRWAFKPECGVSHPVREKWLIDAYGAVWLFTANDSFFPGASLRTQQPLGSFQAHVSYTLRPQLWAAFDATFYVGGRTTVQGLPNDDRVKNTRVGGTLVVPVGRRQSLKLAVAKGAVIRYGADFTTFSVGWQVGWFPRPPANR